MKYLVFFLFAAFLSCIVNAQSYNRVAEGRYGGLVKFPEEQYDQQNWETAKEAYNNILDQNISDNQLNNFVRKRINKINRFNRQENKWELRVSLGTDINLNYLSYKHDLMRAIIDIEKNSWNSNNFHPSYANLYDTMRANNGIGVYPYKKMEPRLRLEYLSHTHNFMAGFDIGRITEQFYLNPYDNNGNVSMRGFILGTPGGVYGSEYGIYEGSDTSSVTHDNTTFTQYVDSFSKYHYSFNTWDLQFFVGYNLDIGKGVISLLPKIGIGVKQINFSGIHKTVVKHGYVREQNSNFLFPFEPTTTTASHNFNPGVNASMVFITPGVSIILRPLLNYSSNLRNLNLGIDFSVKGLVKENYSDIANYHGLSDYETETNLRTYPMLGMSIGYSL